MYCNSPLAVTQYFIRAQMEQRNLEGALECLTDNVEWFGTGRFEIVHGKEVARQYILEEMRALPVGYTIEFEDMTETMLTEDSGTVFGRMLVTDHAVSSQMDCRVTTACVRYEGHFLIASLHMSLPTALQKDREYYPLTIAAEKIDEIRNHFFEVTLPGGLICCEVGEGFRVRYVNHFFVQLLGYQSKEEYLSAINGLFVNCFGESENIAGITQEVQDMETNGHQTFTYRIKKKFGEERWFRGYTYKYEERGVASILCFCMDISDMIQLENELKEQKNQLEFANAEMQTIVSNIPGGVHRCQLFDEIHVDYVSHGFEELSGYTREEIHTVFHDDYSMMLVQEDRNAFNDKVYNLACNPVSHILEYRMQRKDGTIIRVTDHFRSVRMDDGKMWGFGVATDITAQHEALAQLQLLTDSIPGGLVVYESTPNGLTMLYFSDGVCAMVGYTREEYAQIAKTNMASFTFEEDVALLREKIARVAAGDSKVDCVYRHRKKNGGYRWLDVRGIVADRLGDVVRINAVLLDITDAKESAEKLRIRDEEYRLALKQSGKVVYRYTILDQSIYMLQKTTNPFAFPTFASNVPESIIALDLFTPESLNDVVEFYAAISNGEKTGCVTLRCKLEKGGYGWCLTRFTTLFSNAGVPISAVISLEDVTQQHEQELAFDRMSQYVNRLSKEAMLYFETNLTKVKIIHAGGCRLECIKQNLDGDPQILLEAMIDKMVMLNDRDTIRHFFHRDTLLDEFANAKTEKEIEICILYNNQLKWVSIRTEMVADPYTQDILAYVLFLDIDEIKIKEISMLKQAETDGLTDLYNRRATEKKIKQVLKIKRDKPCAFVIIDVDNLKTINDTLGHMQGDRTIQLFAKVLHSHFTKCDLVGRIGGDEFLVFMQDAEDVQNLMNIMCSLVNKLSALRVGKNDDYPLHGSIGVTVSDSGEDTFETLYKQADIALYYVKRHGKNSYAVYSADME